MKETKRMCLECGCLERYCPTCKAYHHEDSFKDEHLEMQKAREKRWIVSWTATVNFTKIVKAKSAKSAIKAVQKENWLDNGDWEYESEEEEILDSAEVIEYR